MCPPIAGRRIASRVKTRCCRPRRPRHLRRLAGFRQCRLRQSRLRRCCLPQSRHFQPCRRWHCCQQQCLRQHHHRRPRLRQRYSSFRHHRWPCLRRHHFPRCRPRQSSHCQFRRRPRSHQPFRLARSCRRHRHAWRRQNLRRRPPRYHRLRPRRFEKIGPSLRLPDCHQQRSRLCRPLERRSCPPRFPQMQDRSKCCHPQQRHPPGRGLRCCSDSSSSRTGTGRAR